MRLWPPPLNDARANDDEQAADNYGGARLFAKSNPRDSLRHDEKHRNVNAQQLAEIPSNGVHCQAVSEQNQRANDQRQAAPQNRMRVCVQSQAHNGVAAHFQQGAKRQQCESQQRIGVFEKHKRKSHSRENQRESD